MSSEDIRLILTCLQMFVAGISMGVAIMMCIFNKK